MPTKPKKTQPSRPDRRRREVADASWREAVDRFIAAIDPTQRVAVERRLDAVHSSGCGLREWVSSIAGRGGEIPELIPTEIIAAYLNDSEALPLHDCEHCGLAVPVRPNRLYGVEAEPECVYFPECPVCGGKTGMYAYWSRGTGTLATTVAYRPNESQ